LAAGLLASCRSGKDPYAPEKPPVPVAQDVRPGTQAYVTSTCGLCDAGCGIRVRVVNGRAVKVEGNPESPVNRGGLCARGGAALELLYHPNRVPGPMRRLGARGEKRWEPISWDDAIAALREPLDRLRSAGRPHGAVLVDGEAQGTTHALWSRFMAAFGSPNHIGHGATGRAGVVETLRTMTGTAGMPGYDFERAACVVLAGTGAIESSPLAMHLSRALAGGARPRLVCLSPRLPSTAALVDEWLAVKPGHLAAALLAILQVLLRDQLVDETLLQKAEGFDRVRASLDQTYSPARVAEKAGIPAEQLESLARELVASRPSVVVVDEETRDPAAVAAAVMLNAALGSLGVAGGMVLGRREGAASKPSADARPLPSCLLSLPEAIISGNPYPVEALLLYYSNPAFSKPDGASWMNAMAKVPFVVSFSPVFDESTLLADLLLPDLTFFERWDLLEPSRGTGVISLRQPVVAPLGDGMQAGQVVLRLASALGGAVAEALPWTSYREAVMVVLHERTGLDEASLDELDKGVCKLRDESEPASESFAGLLSVTPVLVERPTSSVGDAATFPFGLWPFRDLAHAEGGFRDFPWLAELSGGPHPWSGYVEISPDDARRLTIRDGDWVAVTSPVARIELCARVHPHIKPGVLGLRLGGWGRTVGDVHGTPARLLSAVADPEGHWLAHATRAKVEKIG